VVAASPDCAIRKVASAAAAAAAPMIVLRTSYSRMGQRRHI
jgi:hypothetical protein